MAGALDYKAVTTPQLRFRASLLDADVEIAGPRAREPEEVVWRPLAARRAPFWGTLRASFTADSTQVARA